MSIKSKKNRMFYAFIMQVIFFLCFIYAITNIETAHSLEDKKQLEDSLHRAVAACYAAEGVYPPDLGYIEDHYGIRINKDKYSVKYNVFASNMMPDITVLDVAYEK